VRRAGVLALVACGLIVVSASPASAHSVVKSSDPTNGEVLQRSPSRVVIDFTERPDVGLTVVHVLDSGGSAEERGKPQAVPGQAKAVQVAVPSLGRGVYTVTWRTVSRDDGHVTAGSFSFGIGVKPTGVPGGGVTVPTTPSPTPVGVIGRAAFYWGLALLLGAAVAGCLVRRGWPRGLQALLVGAWFLAEIGLVLMVLAERSAIGVSLGTLLSSDAGHQYLDRGVAVLITGGAVGFAVFRPQWTSLPPVGIAAAASMLVHALGGHAETSSPTWFNVGAQWFHMLGAGVWVGGLGWLLLSLRRVSAEDRPALVRRFSRLAGVGLGVVALTGIIRALDELGGLPDLGRLFTTSYGWALVVKLVIAAGLIALGTRNQFANVPRVASGARPPGVLRRTVTAEVVLAVGVFSATGVLTELPPAATALGATRPVAAARPLTVTGNDFATSVRVRLSVTPGTVGPNRFEARVADYDTGRPIDATKVKLEFSLPGNPDVGTPELALKGGRDGVWTGSGTVLSMFGRWAVDVVVQEPTGGVDVPLRLEPRLPTEDVTKQEQPGQPTLFTIGLPGSSQLQTYIDPGKAGTNSVHFTFFGPSGNELPVGSATASALTPDGSTEPLQLDRFSAGHFAANTKLDSGRWLFLIDATARDGTALTGYFRQDIG
jgi:copper transport protein